MLRGALDALIAAADAASLASAIDRLYLVADDADFTLIERAVEPPAHEARVLVGVPAYCGPGCTVRSLADESGAVRIGDDRHMYQLTSEAPRTPRELPEPVRNWEAILFRPARGETMFIADGKLYGFDGRLIAEDVVDAINGRHGIVVRRDDGTVVTGVGARETAYRPGPDDVFELVDNFLLTLGPSGLVVRSYDPAVEPVTIGEFERRDLMPPQSCAAGDFTAVLIDGQVLTGTTQLALHARDLPESAQLDCTEGRVVLTWMSPGTAHQRDCTATGCAPERMAVLPPHVQTIVGIGDRVLIVRELATRFGATALATRFAPIAALTRAPDRVAVIALPGTHAEIQARPGGAWVDVFRDAAEGTYLFDVDVDGALVPIGFP